MAISDSSGCSEAEPFALRVLGDSMVPEFKEGEVVVIDPAGSYGDGSFVIALHADEYIFRQLRDYGGQYYLVPLNDLYETVELRDVSDIKGVVSQKAGRRRKDRKFYDRDSR